MQIVVIPQLVTLVALVHGKQKTSIMVLKKKKKVQYSISMALIFLWCYTCHGGEH